ncbi:MAG: (Na+)-NQR maturation NqrM [Motiliproteus sp.]
MQTFLIVFVVLMLVIVASSVGVIMGRKPIKGSCGGVGAALGETDYTCPLCGDDPNKCEKEQAQAEQQANDTLSYELAAKK